MTKPILAFDCDDVIVSTGALLINHYNKLHGTSVQLHDFYSKDYEHVWRADQETATRDLFAYLLTDDFQKLAPMPGAAETLKQLSDRYTLYIVTGRPDEAEAVTHTWVDRHLPNIFEDIVFTNFFKLKDSKGALRSKAEVCRELSAELLVDDHLHHIKNVSEHGIKGVLFGDLPWEQPTQPLPNVVRVKDWPELARYLD